MNSLLCCFCIRQHPLVQEGESCVGSASGGSVQKVAMEVFLNASPPSSSSADPLMPPPNLGLKGDSIDDAACFQKENNGKRYAAYLENSPSVDPREGGSPQGLNLPRSGIETAFESYPGPFALSSSNDGREAPMPGLPHYFYNPDRDD